MTRMIIVPLVVISVLAQVGAREVRHHPKFPEHKKSLPEVPSETCSTAHELTRNKIMEESMCGEPKDVFIDLPTRAAHLQVMPGSVWVKRCKGLCSESGSECTAVEVRTKQIPVRIYDARTNRESCSWESVEEHVKCGCCSSSPERCRAPRVFNPRKCSCQCPNVEERKMCLKRNQNTKWNRYKCRCEPRMMGSSVRS